MNSITLNLGIYKFTLVKYIYTHTEYYTISYNLSPLPAFLQPVQTGSFFCVELHKRESYVSFSLIIRTDSQFRYSI